LQPKPALSQSGTSAAAPGPAKSGDGAAAKRAGGFADSVAVPVLAATLAVAIFLVDTATPLEAAVAGRYRLVIMLAASVMSRRGLLLVTCGCIALTAGSHLLQHGLAVGSSLLRACISVAAIAITTFLTLRYQAASSRLREQAELLDLTQCAIFV